MNKRTYSVVVVDDVEDMRDLIAIALRRSGRFSVVGEAADGSEAVTVSRALQPDLTLLDLSLPVMDGLEALPLIRAASPDTTVVVLSGFSREGIADRAMAEGASAYLVKGIRPSELVRNLLIVLEDTEADTEVEGASAPLMASLALPLDLTSPRVAREFVRTKVAEWGFGAQLDSALLLTSELITNAVLHAEAESHLHLSLIGGTLRVELADRGAGNLALQEQSLNATSGRGLFLVESLARTWGTSASRSGRTVWFELT